MAGIFDSDPRLAAPPKDLRDAYAALAESPDTEYRASLLPFRRTKSGETKLALPGAALDFGRGLLDLLAGTRTGEVTPQATASLIDLASGGLVSGAGDPATLAAIRAYHGSPKVFDRFRNPEAGKGVQEAGYGTYFSSDPNIASGFRGGPVDYEYVDPATRRATIFDVEKDIYDFDVQDAVLDAKYDVGKALAALGGSGDPSDIARLKAIQAAGGLQPRPMRGGALYEVDLAPDVEDLLDYTKPLSGQSPAVQSAFGGFDPSLSGAAAYAQLARQVGGPQQASTQLSRAGVPGSVYKDVASGVPNYVMYDPNLINIRSRR